MTNDWIIDVLMDLKKFSAGNHMDHLAEQLDDTIMVAASELSSIGPNQRATAGEIEQAGGYAGPVGAGDNA